MEVRAGPPEDAPRGPCSQLQASGPPDPRVQRLHRCDPDTRTTGGQDAPVTLVAMGRALVLNATELPLAVVPARRAVVLVLKEKAEVVQSNGAIFHSERIALEAPSVVRLRHFVHVPFRAHAPLTRRAVFARDGWACQYCGSAAENLDHVLPRSRGGLHVWENVVAACRRCNAKKMDRTPQEAGFHLHRQPFAPSDGFRLTLGQVEPGWEPYLI